MKSAMLKAINEQGGEMISHLIDRLGVTGILTVYGVKVADTAGVIELADSFSDMWGMFDWLGFMGGVGTFLFIIKTGMSMRKEYLISKKTKLEIQLLEIKGKE